MLRIPRHFHFIFGLRPQVEPFHLVHYLCLESCIRVNRPERMSFYYHYEPHGRYWELIRDRLHLERVPLEPRVEAMDYQDPLIGGPLRYAHHADFIRLEKLLEHGGVYADMDTLFLSPLPDALFEQSFVLGMESDVTDPETGESWPSLCNAFIMAEAGAFFGHRWLERMPDALDGSWSNHSCRLAHELSLNFPSHIHIEPAVSFYPVMWTPEGLSALFEQNYDDWFGAYSVHLWAHLWWEEKRKDFSSFHAGLLTERFIRTVDTTYNRAARPYLPPPEPNQWERLAGWWRGIRAEK